MSNTKKEVIQPLFGMEIAPTSQAHHASSEEMSPSLIDNLPYAAPNHRFLKKFSLQDYPVKAYCGTASIHGRRHGPAIALPVFNLDGERVDTVLMEADDDGDILRSYVTGASKKGNYVVIGGQDALQHADKIYITAEIPSAFSINLATGRPVVVPCGYFSMTSVCEDFSLRYKDKQRELCLDRTIGKSHVRSWEKVAARTNTIVTTIDELDPESGKALSLNDVHVAYGLDKLAELIDKDAWHQERESSKQAVRNADLIWPHPVHDGRYLLQKTVGVIQKHNVMRPHQARAIALWIFYSCVYDIFTHAPILLIHSPIRGCGKTTVGSLLTYLVPQPSPTANLSTASLYHEIEENHPVLIIDEADQFLRGMNDLVGIINAGHTRSTAYVGRHIGGKNQRFNVFCPKVILMIGTPPDTIYDRSLAIKMVRKTADEHIEPLDTEWRSRELRILQAQISRWANDNRERIRQTKVEANVLGGGRLEDNWRPLLRIAKAISDEWYDLALDDAKALIPTSSQGLITQLLDDIQQAFITINDDKISSAQLVALLCADPERPWATFNNGRAIGYHQLRGLLDEFDIHSDDIRFPSGKVLKGYRLEWFKDAFARYGSITFK